MTTANLIAYKAPTTVLLKPDGTFEAFGFEAEERYSQLIDEEGSHNGWYYIQNFKMELYRQQVNFKSLFNTIKLELVYFVLHSNNTVKFI